MTSGGVDEVVEESVCTAWGVAGSLLVDCVVAVVELSSVDVGVREAVEDAVVDTTTLPPLPTLVGEDASSALDGCTVT